METFPFKHLEILDFLSSEHLAEILNTPEIKLPPAASDAALLDNLINLGYKPIPFPGTTRNIDEYLTWHANKGKHTNIETCEGIGMTLRLMERKSQILIELDEFFNSEEFLSCIANKFNLDRSATYPDNGLQKYLDGYEISPHPDIRKKALTYMLNVNPDPNSQLLSFHTHYMTFIDNKP